MSWKGPALDGDQRDLLAMLGDLTADSSETAASAEDTDSAAEDTRLAGQRQQLTELGLWTLGADEKAGGAGADGATTVLAWQRIARAWPAAAWASVQAHAALDILADSTGHAETREAIAAGTLQAAVVVAGGTGTTLEGSGAEVRGTIHRVDAGDEAPFVIVIDPREHSAVLIGPAECSATPLETTGLDGARSATLSVEAADAETITGPGVTAGLSRLLVGLTAIAAGVADAAADEAVDYASQRRQFGDVLTAIPNVRSSLGAQQRNVARIVAAAVAAAAQTGAGKTGTAASAAALTATARDAVTTAVDVATSALQSHGGYGFLMEYPAARRLRDALSLQAVCDLHSLEVAGSLTLTSV